MGHDDCCVKDGANVAWQEMRVTALGMELSEGLALHEARQLGDVTGENLEKLSKRRREAQERMVANLRDSVALSNEGAIFVERFWGNFYRAMLTHTLRKGLTKLSILFLLVPLLCRAQALPPKPINLVIAIDLSTSVASTGHDNRSDFQKDVAGVTQLLSNLPPATRVTVIGITENSFSYPYILLSAKITDEKGYFGERTAAARQQILRVWRERSSQLEPRAQCTDILGALIIAGQLFAQARAPEQKVLVLYSDMRQFTRGLNLETGNTTIDQELLTVGRDGFVPDLNGVTVYVLGADAAGITVQRWEHVRQFWAEYFAKARANLTSYSMLREPLTLTP